MITELTKHDKAQRFVSAEQAHELKKYNKQRTGITYSVLTSDTDSGGMMCDAASADCEISALFNDTTSSKLEWISATCSPS